jgi:hypothetical protein
MDKRNEYYIIAPGSRGRMIYVSSGERERLEIYTRGLCTVCLTGCLTVSSQIILSSVKSIMLQ